MTAAHDIDWPTVLADRLTTTSPDVLRELLATFIHALMGAEADAVCGAGAQIFTMTSSKTWRPHSTPPTT
jgi:hypothetical protein